MSDVLANVQSRGAFFYKDCAALAMWEQLFLSESAFEIDSIVLSPQKRNKNYISATENGYFYGLKSNHPSIWAHADFLQAYSLLIYFDSHLRFST